MLVQRFRETAVKDKTRRGKKKKKKDLQIFVYFFLSFQIEVTLLSAKPVSAHVFSW